MNALQRISCSIQRQLFPAWEAEVGTLSAKEQQFVRIVALVEVERFMAPYQWQWLGRKSEDRLPLARRSSPRPCGTFPCSVPGHHLPTSNVPPALLLRSCAMSDKSTAGAVLLTVTRAA